MCSYWMSVPHLAFSSGLEHCLFLYTILSYIIITPQNNHLKLLIWCSL